VPAGFDDGFPGYDDGEPPAFDETAWASASPLPPSGEQRPSNGNGYGVGNGHHTGNGNGHHTGNGAARDPQAHEGAEWNGAAAVQQAEENGTGDGQGGPPAPPPAAATPITVVRPRQRIQIAKKEDESRPAAPAPSGPQYHLHVTINRTEDFDADVRCMQEVDRVLRRFVGQHKISLYIPRSDCIVVLEPLNRINPAPELIAALTELLGEGRVQLEGAP
jgi:DNA polymerase-3 subunit alpha